MRAPGGGTARGAAHHTSRQAGTGRAPECGILAGTASDSHVLRLLPPFILEDEHVELLRDALRELPP